jgi:hypothetical protein
MKKKNIEILKLLGLSIVLLLCNYLVSGYFYRTNKNNELNIFMDFISYLLISNIVIVALIIILFISIVINKIKKEEPWLLPSIISMCFICFEIVLLLNYLGL